MWADIAYRKSQSKSNKLKNNREPYKFKKKRWKVKVLSGNDKGKTGEVLEVIPKTQKVIVKGVNIRKKHVKPRKQGEEGGIIPVECSIHSSKVNVVCPKCNKATRVGYLVDGDTKVRVCKKCGNKLK